MRVFVAGATGAIGRQLVPRLVAAGHEVHGMTRSESKQGMLDELGAVPVVADALDREQVAEAVGRARPDVIVHQLTALAGVERYTERDAAPTNRLRTRGHGPPALRWAGGGSATVCGPGGSGLWRVRAQRWAGEERGGPARSCTRAADARHAGRDPSSRGGGPRCPVDGGDRAALRRVLWAGHLVGVGRGAVRAGAPAQVPAGRRRWRRVVVHSRRRRGARRRSRRSSTAAMASTTWSTMTRPRWPSGCRRWLRRWARRSRCACRGSLADCSPGSPAW